MPGQHRMVSMACLVTFTAVPGHMTMLLGAAKLLKAVEDKLPGRVRFLFQPAEERHGGAKKMIEEGALQGLRALFALHGEPSDCVAVEAVTAKQWTLWHIKHWIAAGACLL